MNLNISSSGNLPVLCHNEFFVLLPIDSGGLPLLNVCSAIKQFEGLSIEMGWVSDKLPKKPDGYQDLDSLNERQTLKILVMGEVWEYCKQNNLLDQTEIFYRIYESAFRKGKLYAK